MVFPLPLIVPLAAGLCARSVMGYLVQWLRRIEVRSSRIAEVAGSSLLILMKRPGMTTLLTVEFLY